MGPVGIHWMTLIILFLGLVLLGNRMDDLAEARKVDLAEAQAYRALMTENLKLLHKNVESLRHETR